VTACMVFSKARIWPSSPPQRSRSPGQEQLPRGKELLFALGSLGWSSIANVVSIQLVYFYIPPEVTDGCNVNATVPTNASTAPESKAIFPLYVIPDRILVVFNIVVILASVGRLWDAVTDPMIASFSDRLRTKRGRRIPCMAVATLPTAATAFLLFWPLVDEVSAWNIVWLGIMQFLFYAALTLYMTPYFALLPELGRTEQQRLDLSMWCAVCYMLGAVVGGSAPTIGRIFVSGDTPQDAAFGLRMGIVAITIIAFISMLVPVFAIDEVRYCLSPHKTPAIRSAIRHCLRNKFFRMYVVSDAAFFFAQSVILTAMPFYVTVLLCESIHITPVVIGAIVGFSLFWCVPVNTASHRVGKKRLVIISLLTFTLLFAYIFFLGPRYMPGLPTMAQIFIFAPIVSLPICILASLPNAILADIAVHDALVTGVSNEGMFFAARSLIQKFGTTLGVLVFASLTNFGRSPGDDLGVRLSGPVCVVVMLAATCAFTFYDERKLLHEIKSAAPPAGGERGATQAELTAEASLQNVKAQVSPVVARRIAEALPEAEALPAGPSVSPTLGASPAHGTPAAEKTSAAAAQAIDSPNVNSKLAGKPGAAAPPTEEQGAWPWLWSSSSTTDA